MDNIIFSNDENWVNFTSEENIEMPDDGSEALMITTDAEYEQFGDSSKTDLDSLSPTCEEVNFDENMVELKDVDIIDMNNVEGINLNGILNNNTEPALLDMSANGGIILTVAEADVAAVISEAAKQTSADEFNASEEQKKLLEFLESQPKLPEPQVVLPVECAPTPTFCIIRCANCNCIFDNVAFQSHVCDYDEHSNLICPAPAPATLPAAPSKKKSKVEKSSPPDLHCIRILRENQIRIRRFLKDELKYDIAGGLSGTSGANTSGTNSNNVAAAPSGSGASNNNTGKKQYGPHECNLCDRKFVHASGLLRHMEKHALDLIPTPGSGPNNALHSLRVTVKCNICGRVFMEPRAALTHLDVHFPDDSEEEFELDNYGEIPYDSYVDDALQFLSNEAQGEAELNPNYNSEKPDFDYFKMVVLNCVLQCEFCDFAFSDLGCLFAHSAHHSPERRYECFACNIEMQTLKEVCTHWQTECVYIRENLKVHQAALQRYFACNVCETKFSSLEQLYEHRYTAYHLFPRLSKLSATLLLPCENCSAIFETAQECFAHFEEKHCKKYKRDKDGVTTFGKARQYLCDICGKSYTQSSHLWQHLRFHQGVKPFACKEAGCTRKFTIRPDLNDHIRKCHTGERPYHCLVCGKRFLTGSVFYQHRLIHRGERRYECEECGKRFYRADALKNHQRIHTGEKPFGCLFCTKNFRQRGDRDKHIRARHSHLDANTRLMMQMQKIQLEAAAAAAAAAAEAMKERPENDEEVRPDMNPQSLNGFGEILQQTDNIIMIGNLGFPKSMFEPMVADIDQVVLEEQQQE